MKTNIISRFKNVQDIYKPCLKLQFHVTPEMMFMITKYIQD